MAFDPSTAQLDSTFDPDTATESPAPGFKAGDYLKGLKRGVLAVPGALTGLADIPLALATGERVAGPVADALGRATGFQPSKWAKETGETFSPGAKAAQAKIEEAWKGSGADRLGNALLGNFDDLPEAWKEADLAGAGKAIVENPGASALQVVESLPAMLAGGAIGKGVAVASKLAPAIAGAIGEGAITAGQQMDQTDAAVDPRRAAATSATAGALTGAIAGGMGRVAQKLGLEDIQTTMAGGKANATGLGRAGRLAGGTASEALQEIPQSAQEQVWQNVAEEKPLGEGVVRSAVEGGIAGGVMGAGANLRRPGTPLPPPGATAPGDIAEMDTLNAGLTQAGNDYAGQLPPNAGLLEEKPLVVQNPTTGVVTEIDRRGGPLEQAAAIAVESGAHEVAQNVDASEILFPYANARAAQDYIGRQADPEMYDAVPHPRVEGRTAVVPKTGPARQAILDKRAAGAANEQGKLRGEQLKQDESPAPTEITESIAGTFGNGSTGNVTITPQRGGGFEIRVSSSDGATKRSSVAGFPAGTNRAKAIAAATRSHGGFTKDKPVAKAKPVADTTVEDAAQDELAPPTVQPVTDMPGVQQRAKAQAQGAVAKAQTRAAQLADEETVDTQAQAANPEPSEAQKAAGNYAHGHIRVGGLDISVETPAGATRTGMDKGKPWKVKNTAHYGYVKRSKGADGEQVDVYVKPGTSSTSEGPVFVVDQYNLDTGAFDEHKALLGYGNQAEAAATYDSHFNDKTGPKRRGAVTPMSLAAFKGWLADGDTSKAVSGKRFGKAVADNEQAAQDEIARSTGKMSLPRSAQKQGESDAAFELRRAAATQAAKTARVAGQQALPTRDNDKAGVREALGMPDDAEVSILSAESRPDAGQAKGVSKQAAQFVQQVARTFGKRVVFFDVPDRGAAEGFYVRGNTIYLNTNSATQHLRVLGHEMTHAMKRQARDSYEKMLGAVAALRTDEEMAAQFNDYFGQPLDDVALLDQPHPGSDGTLREFLAEEWMADLGGNRFAESEFWTSVFGRLEGQHGTEAAKGIVARLRLALVAALNKLKTLIGGNAFAVDARLGEHLEGIRAAVAEGFAEYARLSKAGQLADVAGEAKFKQPGSDLGHKRESDGRYVGAPEWVGNSPQQLAVLRKKLLQLTLEGEPGRFWYEQSSKAILDLAKGDKAEAEKIVQLIAIYSPSAMVPGNTTMALKAYYQWKQGQPIRVGFGQADRKASALLYEGKEWKGMKTNTFYSNLMEEIDPSKNLDGATMDMWMAIAFDYGSKALDQGTKYKFAERETQRIAKRLGWSPHQVQAAIWTAMKGRVDPIRGVLTAQELDNGWYDEESQAWWASGEKAKYESRRDAALRDRAAGKRTPFARVDVGTEKLQPARRKDHYHLAHKLGMEYNLTQEDVMASKYDFSNAIRERTAQMSWEATPGETTGVLPGIHKAPMHQQQEYLVAIRKALSDEKGNDLIGKEVGLALATSVQGFSGWQGVSTVGIQDGIAVPIDSATSAVQQMAIDAINLVADIKGLVLYQEGVAWHFPNYKGSKNGQNGVEFRIGRLLTEEENANLYKGLVAALGHTYAPPIPTQDGQGFRVLNFPDEKFALMDDFGKSPEEQKRKKGLQKAQLEKNVAFIESVADVVFKQPWHAEVTDEVRFESIGELRENDWSKGDGDYRGRIEEAQSRWPQTQDRWAGRSDILGWIEHDLRPRVAEVNRDFSERYGWGKASLSPRRGVAGPDAAGNRQLGGDGQAGLRRQVQPESVSAVGVHYSKQPRERLDSSYFGTGIPGAEVERVADATDPRIKQRIYFYVNNGRPIKPEEGVGSHAHQAQLDNLYDYANDPLDLRVTNTFSGFESALLDKGFDGAINLERGIAVLLGQRNLAVEYIGQNDSPDVPQAAQAEPSFFGKQMRAVAANRGLPSGEMTGADWKRLMPKLMPDIDVSHLNDEQRYYKDEVVKRPQALAKMSPQREGLPEGFRVEANPISEGRKFIVTDASGTRLGSGETREEAIARFKEVHAALYPAVPESPASPSILDGARLKALRRTAAGLETPQRGVFLRVTDDGKAIASGPKGARIPEAFRRFAHDNGLSFYAERKGYAQASAKPMYAGGRTSGDGYRGIPYASIAGVSEPIPIAYRESGALYFGEMGAAGLDRTDKTRFSTQRLAQLDTTTTTDNGIRFETGKPVTFPYLHNKESATKLFGVPLKDAPFDRGFEPSGKYVTVSDAAYLAKDSPQKYEAGTLTFNNPLVLSVKGWKPALSKAFGNLTGKRLSQALISAGFDGVVTAHEKGGASEVLDLTSFDLKKAKYSTQRYSIERDEEDEGTFAVARDPSQKDEDGAPLEVGRLHVPDEAVSSKGWRIGDIEVSPASRRQGIASELIRRMTEELGVPVTGATSVFSPDGKALFEAVRAAKLSTQRLAPNGKPSKLDERQWQQVRTPEFKAWFGDWEAAHNGKDGSGVWARDDVSKVVDENGEPLVVYHGTERGGFTTFRPDKADRQRSPMIFAAATRETARTYAGRGTEIELNPSEEPLAGYRVVKTEVENYPWKVVDQYGSDVDAYQRFQSEAMAQKWLDMEREDAEPENQVGVYSLFLNLRNPNEADFEGANWDGAAPYGMYEVIDDNDESFYSSQGDRFMDIVTARIVAERHGLSDDAVRPAQDRYETTNTVAEEAKRYGKDGAIIRRTLDDGGNSGRPADVDDVFVVFDANQLKSAVGNTGTFSTKNDDIRYNPQRTVNIDGVDRPTKNSKGKPIAQDEEGLRNFWRWFGDSKAVEAVNVDTGKPVESSREPRLLVPSVLYHTTRRDVAVFEAGRETRNSGTFGDWDVRRHAIFATPDLGASQEYGKVNGLVAKGANTLPLYAKAERPLDLTEGVSEEAEEKLVGAGMSPRAVIHLGRWDMFDDENGSAFVNAAKAAGYDSVIFNDENPETGEAFEAWALFDANQLKSAVGNTGTFSTENDDIRYSPPRFFSQLQRTFESAPAKLQTQPAAQWKLWLAGQQAVKKDEIAWSGINDWLDLQGKAKVSRAQIQEYLAHNGVQLKDVVLGEDLRELTHVEWAQKNFPDVYRQLIEAKEKGNEEDATFFNHVLTQQFQLGMGVKVDGDTKFDQYVLPGGQNYRELLITLPDATSYSLAERKKLARLDSERQLTAAEQARYAELQRETKGKKAKFKSDHFDEPNILAHVRFNERIDTDGNKVLFLEELQSDWGQQGKRKGFGPPPLSYYLVSPTGHRMRDYPSAEEAKDAAEAMSFPGGTYTWEHGTPHRPYVEPGPFVTDTKAWTALALKRAILWAAQNGFSKVAWTTGEQQTERYDLSKHVGYITLDRGYPEGYSVTAYSDDAAADEILQKDVKTPEELADVIGKDAADKLLRDMGPGTHGELARPDIKVGGEGMSAYYDSIVPQVANDLLRKVGGGKVETVEVAKNGREGKSVRQIDRPGMKTRGDLFEQPGFTITPVMTAKVAGEGLPLFSPVRANLGALSPAQAAAANNVLGTPKTFMERLAEFRKDWAKNLKQGIFDQFAPIAELDQQAYIQARLSKGGESTLEALMLYGKLFVGADGATDVRYARAAGKQGFAGKMAALKGEHDRFLLWVAAQRADRLQAIGLENLWTPNDIVTLKGLDQGAMKDGTARPALYAQALQDLNAFNDNVLDVAVSSGLIDDATRQMYAGTPYVPFYRLQEDDTVTGFGIKPGLVNQYAWQKLKGGTQKLNEDLLANLLHNWSHLITASAKNRAAKATLDAAATAGIAAQVPAGMPGKGHVSYKAAGQEQVFVVSDPHLFDAVAALHYAGLGPWAKPLAAAKHWLTIGVTANPAFKVRNLIRDSIGALGAAQLSYNVAGNLQQGWQATAEDNETRAHLLASGGMIRFGSMLDGKDSQRAADLIHEGVDPAMILDSDAKIKKFWRRYVHPALSAYNEFGDRTENINRAALYEQLIAKGLTNAEAAYWSRDLMDFAMAGKWTAIRTLTQTVPFFNARLQGLYKLGRAGKQDIRRLGTVLGAVSLSSLALLLAYGDDDDWKKRSDSDRNNYWWFRVGGHAFRLPKPFEIGAVGTLAERGYELMFEKEMTDARFGRNMRDIVMSQLSMNPVPQLFKPMMDIYANKDAFTGQAIESMGMERLRKEDRYDERTSEVARFLGGLGLPDPTQLVMGRWDTLSPKQVDFLARSYFSWLGTMTTTALDYGIRPMLDRGVRSEMQLKEVFFAGNFVESLPSNQSRYLTQLYDQAREIEQAYASYHHLLKLGDLEGAKEIREEEGSLIKRYPATQQLKRAESLLNQQLQRINASTTLSSEEKRVRLDQVYARRNTLAERFQAQ